MSAPLFILSGLSLLYAYFAVIKGRQLAGILSAFLACIFSLIGWVLA